MKESKYLFRSLSCTFLLVASVACNSSLDFTVKEGGVSSGKVSPSNTQLSESATVRVKNYNQYNMSLQKLTGINRSNHTEIFDEIKASLPSANEISGMTPFNLIAMSRLADAYCKDFVDQKIPANYFEEGQSDLLIDFMFERFLDKAPEDQPDYYSTLRDELNNIYSNDDGTGNKLFPVPDTSIKEANKDYSVAACVVILASPYITLLE